MPVDPPSSIPTSSDTLDGIGRAFFGALEQRASPLTVALALLALVVVIAIVLVRRRHEEEDDAHTAARLVSAARHELDLVKLAETGGGPRVGAHVPVRVLRVDRRGTLLVDAYETQSVGAYALEILSHRRVFRGARFDFELDLPGQRPLSLHGLVTRVERAEAEGAPALVTLSLAGIDNASRERLAMWVAKQQALALAEARRGRPCRICRRPVADDGADAHSTCLAHAETSSDAAA